MARQQYGYAKGPTGEIIKNEAEQIVIARMRELKSQGLSVREIAATLSFLDIKARQGGSWHYTQIAMLLRKEAPTKSIGFRPQPQVAQFLGKLEQPVVNILMNKLVLEYLERNQKTPTRSST